MDKTVSQIVRYFHSASLKGEEVAGSLSSRPGRSGKSSLVEKLKKGLETLPPFYAVENCPDHEEPLHLIPRHLRKEFSKMLGVDLEGDLCPACRYKLKEDFQGKWEEFPVKTYDFSIRAKRGVGVVPPVDPNGPYKRIDWWRGYFQTRSFSRGDPRVLDLSGALNVSNTQCG